MSIEEVAEVRRAYESTDRNKISPTYESIKTLFVYYYKYVGKFARKNEDQAIACGDCRRHVFGYWDNYFKSEVAEGLGR